MVLGVFKMIDTSGFLTALKCTEFVFGWGSVPDLTGGAYNAPPGPLAGSRSLIEGERKGTGGTPPFANSWIRP